MEFTTQIIEVDDRLPATLRNSQPKDGGLFPASSRSESINSAALLHHKPS